MTRLFALPIKKQLYLMALIVAIPAAGIIIYSGFQKRNEDIEAACKEAQKLADSITSEQKNLVAGAQQLLSTLAQLPDVRNHNPASVQRILTGILRLNPQYLNIFIADRAGTMWVSAVPTKAVISIADRRHFINARETGRFSSGECITGRLLHKSTQGFSYPINDKNGEFGGSIVVNFDPENFRTLLEQSKLPAGSNYVIIDHRGMILSGGLKSTQVVGRQIRQDLLQQMRHGPEGRATVGPGVDDIEYFTYFRKLHLKGEETPYMYILAGIPVSAVTSEANKALYHNLALLTPAMIVALLLVWFIAKCSIVDRIALLEKASQHLAGGDLEIRISTLITGGELGSLGTSFDAMAERLAVREQALLKSERNYREIFNATSDAIFVHDVGTGNITEVNRSVEEMYGYAQEEMLRLTVHEISSGEHPYSMNEARRWIDKAVAEGSQSFEWLARGKNGICFWVEVVLSSTTIGGEGRVLAVVRDISNRKVAERKIKALNGDLICRADELEAANRELEAFSYTVSNDLRTPLASISTCCQVFMQLWAGKIDEQGKDCIDEIFLATKRMDHLITSLLDLSHISRSILNWECVDLSEIAKAIAAELQLNQPMRRVRFLIEEGRTAFGDNELLRLVMTNLLENAWKYTGKMEEAVIEFGMREDKKQTTYFIRDNGVGFDMGEAGRLFGAFQRLHSGKEFEGHGIGLATVQRIIHRHGGRVWAEGKVGKGCTFFFSLKRKLLL